jgi:hypothetical protein
VEPDGEVIVQTLPLGIQDDANDERSFGGCVYVATYGVIGRYV